MTQDELIEGLKNGTLNLCGCLGAINGQPHCPCKMAKLAKEEAEKCNIYEHDPLECGFIDRPIQALVQTA